MSLRAALLLLLAAPLGCGDFGLLTVNTLARFGSYDRTPDVAYGELAAQRLDVYRPRGVERAPIVVFFYGGRWTTGSRSEYRFVGEALASRGLVAVIPDYRKFPDVRFPTFVKDAAAAVRWVQEQAESLGGDPSDVFVMGHSSGAHMAALLALDSSYLGVAVDSPPLRGMIGLAGPYDFNARREDLRDIFEGALYERTQPIAYAREARVPLLLLHGEADGTVFKKNAVNLAAAVAAAGGRVQTRYYAEIDHAGIVAALSIPMRGSLPVLDDVARFVAEESTGEP